MGKDNRVIDSDANEAKVDSGNEALQVHTFFDSTADLDTIEATLTNIEKALNSIDTDFLKVQITDGSQDVNPVKLSQVRSANDGGIIAFGYRGAGTQYLEIPVAAWPDSRGDKANIVVPVTPMTGGREEGVFTRGFIPENPLRNQQTANATSGAYLALANSTVTSGNTRWITDIQVTDVGVDIPGVEFIVLLQVAASTIYTTRVPSGSSLNISFITPIKAVSGEGVRFLVRQWSGATRSMQGTILSFETTDSELD